MLIKVEIFHCAEVEEFLCKYTGGFESQCYSQKHMTEDQFDVFADGHIDNNGSLYLLGFCDVLKKELRGFIQRKTADVVKHWDNNVNMEVLLFASKLSLMTSNTTTPRPHHFHNYPSEQSTCHEQAAAEAAVQEGGSGGENGNGGFGERGYTNQEEVMIQSKLEMLAGILKTLDVVSHTGYSLENHEEQLVHLQEHINVLIVRARKNSQPNEKTISRRRNTVT